MSLEHRCGFINAYFNAKGEVFSLGDAKTDFRIPIETEKTSQGKGNELEKDYS